uniref:Homeobox domain-containing protein/START domain-containing protein n=1 Tax=Tanacetum cinerariifolium TaxID=118510 RepID=A0A6L2MJ88_TANCI|nr:homeobox domain-containing protein/START domain-containing protein [Tanacetum cinerariifolium]
MQATPPLVPNRKFTVLRTCLQIDQGTWVIAEPSHVNAPNTYRQLPSGCLIERITEKLSKVTWVEHMEVAEPLPNRSGFAFAAERMVAWLERSCERGSHKNATCRIKAPGYKEKILEKLSLMNFGESMVHGLFENVGPNEDCNSTLWRSVTGSEDMKVYDSLYKSSANFEVVGGAVTFGVRHSPELVLETLGDEEIHHEVWNVLGGLTKLCTLTKYSTGGDTRNNISASMPETVEFASEYALSWLSWSGEDYGTTQDCILPMGITSENAAQGRDYSSQKEGCGCNCFWKVPRTRLFQSKGSKADSSLFIIHKGPDTTYLLLYVDDIILTASSTSLLQCIISLLHAEFAMTDLDSLNYFLGISAMRTTSGIFLSQTKYAIEILEQAQMLNCNPCRTPINTEKKLGPEGSPVTDPTLYCSLAGSLQLSGYALIYFCILCFSWCQPPDVVLFDRVRTHRHIDSNQTHLISLILDSSYALDNWLPVAAPDDLAIWVHKPSQMKDGHMTPTGSEFLRWIRLLGSTAVESTRQQEGELASSLVSDGTGDVLIRRSLTLKNGARCVATLLHEMKHRGTDCRFAVMSMCILIIKADSSLFIFHKGRNTAYLLLYVDDIILTTSSTSLLQHIISLLHAEFLMTDLDPLNYFLGISVMRTTSGIFLSQTKFATEILEQAHMLNCNHYMTSIDTEKKLRHEGSSDTLSRSSAPAAETSLIRSLLRELHIPLFTATLVYCDNFSVVYMFANLVQHQPTKRIEIDIHFVRGKVVAGHVRVLHVPSRFQYADIFRKGDWPTEKQLMQDELRVLKLN